MATLHLALVSETSKVSLDQLTPVSAAIQKQVTEDFGPIWDVSATINAYPRLSEVPPLGYWPIVIRDNLNINEVGVHLVDSADKPFALVAFRPEDWTLTIGHEALEMLADPVSTSFEIGPSPAPDQGLVEFLVEVCDPCQGLNFAYEVNGVTLSDFVVREYYTGFGDGRYSFRGHLTQPRDLMPGGYVTWRDPATANWWQQIYGAEQLRDLGPHPAPADVHLRGAIDRDTRAYMAARTKRAKKTPRAPGKKPAAAQSRFWQQQIDRVVYRSR